MQVQPPIFYLRNSFIKSLELAINQKMLVEIEDIITVDLSPPHIKADFTFPIFEIAKILKADYSQLASGVAKNLRNYKKYIHRVETVNGYINVTIKKKFYIDSLRYILKANLLQEMSKSKKIKKVLLVSEEIKTDFLVNHLYTLPLYVVKTVSIDENPSHQQTRSFLRQITKIGKVKDFGNNVLAINLEDKYQLLQKQDKTPTTLLRQLISLENHIKKSNSTMIIFSLNIISQSIYEFLAIVHTLQIIKKGMREVIINNTDIENKIDSHLNSLRNLQKKISGISKNKSDFDSEIPIQLKDSEMKIARLISYAPEVFRQSLLQASPEIIINYSQLYRSIKFSVLSQKTNSSQLVLQAIYNIFNTTLNLFSSRQSP